MPQRFCVIWQQLNVAEMRSAEISIEEDDVAQYLMPFLYKYFDDELDANKKRVEDYLIDDDGIEHVSPVSGFEWYLTHNFFTFDSIEKILKDIKDTIDALSTGRENEFTTQLRKKRGTATYELLYAKDLSEEQIKVYNANRPKEDHTEIVLLLDFYYRFTYRMEYMLKVGKYAHAQSISNPPIDYIISVPLRTFLQPQQQPWQRRGRLWDRKRRG